MRNSRNDLMTSDGEIDTFVRKGTRPRSFCDQNRRNYIDYDSEGKIVHGRRSIKYSKNVDRYNSSARNNREEDSRDFISESISESIISIREMERRRIRKRNSKYYI